MNAQGDAVKPRVGISSCLLGEMVRYSGGHSRDRFLTDTFGRFVDWVPVCPEVECGLPVPREAMRLVGDPEAPRLVTINSRIDHTACMNRWAKRRVRELESEDLVGFVFKSRSPSSGMERVKIYDEGGRPRGTGAGLFARAFMERFPLLPVEDEGRLHDPGLRENFIERVFCLRRYRDAVRPRRTRRALVGYHTSHKLQVMAHSPALLREMGRLVARAKETAAEELFGGYESLLLRAMKLIATPGKNANVLQHAIGYFKSELSGDERAEAQEVIERFRLGLIPLIVPVTLLRHYIRRYGQTYLSEQTYFDPHPLELKLRNHA
jgi:uncharacterized protein YbgA (DUF1722 family)/uncharacterized protein YbbK (DUF523 family)